MMYELIEEAKDTAEDVNTIRNIASSMISSKYQQDSDIGNHWE